MFGPLKYVAVLRIKTLGQVQLTHDFGAMCKKPAELTAFNRLRSDTNAVL
jgi:hypothetical protein